MAETTNEQLKPYDVQCPGCGEEYEAEIPVIALVEDGEEEFTVECPECKVEGIIVYDAAKDAVGLAAMSDGDDYLEDDDLEDDDLEEDEEDEDE